MLLSIILFCHIISQNITISIQYLENKALNETKNISNIYVANALVMGGFDIHGYNTAAYNFYYNKILENAGFIIIGNESKVPNFLPGDIMVNLNTSKHPYGHICMYNGSKWISDYVQDSIYTFSDEIDIPTIFFRYKDIISDDSTEKDIDDLTNNNNKSNNCFCYEYIINEEEEENEECDDKMFEILFKDICPLFPDENTTEEEINKCFFEYLCGSEDKKNNKTHYLNISILFYYIFSFLFFF